jgi:hypothetical protein
MLRYFPIEYDAFARWPGTLEVTSLLFPFNVTSIHPSRQREEGERGGVLLARRPPLLVVQDWTKEPVLRGRAFFYGTVGFPVAPM